MARRSSMFSPQLASVALVSPRARCGGRLRDRVKAEPAAGGAAVRRRVASPSAPPSASPSPQTFSVVVTDEHEIDHPVDVIDESGRLVAVDPGPATRARIGDAAASTDPESDTRLFVTWAFTGCNDPTSITVDQPR